jgi:HK97 family phage major capsid protein
LLVPRARVLAIVAALLVSFGSAPRVACAPFGLAGDRIDGRDRRSSIDDMKSTFEKFKETHSALETEQKKLGSATSETNEQLKKLNARLDEIEIKAQRARTMAGIARIDDEIREERESGARGPERKAFAKWARRGHTRLTDDEVKSLVSLKHLDPEEGEYKALETDSDVEGGVFVPHQLANRVIQKLILVSPFRSVAAVETISTARSRSRRKAQQLQRRLGRRARFAQQTNTASRRMERIPVHEMYAEPPVSQTQLDDSVFDIETWLSSRVSTVMAQSRARASSRATASPAGRHRRQLADPRRPAADDRERHVQREHHVAGR